jgi:DNA mismatch endonuclease (patch repair protein)
VLPRYQIAVFVHGCFWHGHDCKAARRPSSNVEFWVNKIESNIARDRLRQAELQEAGWSVAIIWSCSLDQGLATLLEHLEALDQTL